MFRAPGDYPSGERGDVLTVEFTVLGIPCVGLNGGPAFAQSEAFSFQVATADQAETDRYWEAIVGNGGAESACGWCKDRWGVSWQITPVELLEAIEAARRGSGALVLAVGQLELRGLQRPGCELDATLLAQDALHVGEGLAALGGRRHGEGVPVLVGEVAGLVGTQAGEGGRACAYAAAGAGAASQAPSRSARSASTTGWSTADTAFGSARWRMKCSSIAAT